MKGKIKIAVADDQAMFRSGLVSLLNDIPNVKVLVEAGDGKELIRKLRETTVDIVFLDYRMPNLNGASAAKIIRTKYPDTRILMLSMYDDEEFIVNAIENGANGYLTKDDEPEEIYRAIQSVMSTKYYANDRTSKILIASMMAHGKIDPQFKPEKEATVSFSDQEILTMQLIAKEYSTREIAEKMQKSERTVEGYRERIMEKTGAKNLVGIVMFGVKNGYISL